MNVSRTMVAGWLTVAASVLALPQLLAVVPESALPYVALAAGLITLTLRWLNGALGANTLSAVGVLTLLVGALELPELGSVIPVAYTPYATAIAGVATLISRYLAGTNAGDPATSVGLLMKNGGVTP